MSVENVLDYGRGRVNGLLSFRDKSVHSLHRLGVYLVTGFAIAFFGFPIYWMFISSLKPIESIASFPPSLVPVEPTLENYVELFLRTSYLDWMVNSAIISVGIVVLTVLLSTLAGYALTRYTIPYKKWLAASFILAYLFPPITVGIPYFVLFLELGLINELPSVILATTAVTLPFSTWLMWQFFQTVPISLEEAAWANGASRIRGIFEVALPSAMPGIVAVAIYSFALGWNVFLFPYIFLQTPDMQVLTTGIFGFLQSDQLHFGIVMAAAAVICIPPLIIVFLLNRFIMEGFAVQSQ